jgi:hypothetical protein
VCHGERERVCVIHSFIHSKREREKERTAWIYGKFPHGLCLCGARASTHAQRIRLSSVFFPHVFFFFLTKKGLKTQGSTLWFIFKIFPISQISPSQSSPPAPTDCRPTADTVRPSQTTAGHRSPPADRRSQTNGAHDPSPSLPTDTFPARLSLGPATHFSRRSTDHRPPPPPS